MRAKDLIRVNNDYLMAGDKTIDFNIYTLRSSDNTPILLINKDTDLADVREKLLRRKMGHLYIERHEQKIFQCFMEDSMGAIIGNDRIPLPKKSEIIYSCAKNIMQDVLENPRSGENINRARSVTENIIKFSLSNYDSIPNILKLGSRDYYTFSHCVNVAVFAIGLLLMIGQNSEEELEECALGCLLHDVGKSEIDIKVLNKPGKLTEEEFEVIKTHPEKGYHLMKGYVSDPALDIILHHHEKADGRGYPEGLREDQIPDCVKIATIADVYDALTTERPYACARPPFKALMLMKDSMVGHFEQKKFINFIEFLGNTQAAPPC